MLDSVTPQRPEKIRASSVAFKQMHQEQSVRTIFMAIRLSVCETKLGLKLLQCPVLLMLLVSFLSAQLACVFACWPKSKRDVFHFLAATV